MVEKICQACSYYNSNLFGDDINYLHYAFQAGSFSPVVGSLVWIEDPDDAWIDGEVLELNGENIKVLCTSGKTVCTFCNICFLSSSFFG